MKIFTLTAALVISMCALTTSGQDLKKPYTEWSERNAQKIATQSGWAKTYTSIEGLAAAEADKLAAGYRAEETARAVAVSRSPRKAARAAISRAASVARKRSPVAT